MSNIIDEDFSKKLCIACIRDENSKMRDLAQQINEKADYIDGLVDDMLLQLNVKW